MRPPLTSDVLADLTLQAALVGGVTAWTMRLTRVRMPGSMSEALVDGGEMSE